MDGRDEAASIAAWQQQEAGALALLATHQGLAIYRF